MLECHSTYTFLWPRAFRGASLRWLPAGVVLGWGLVAFSASAQTEPPPQEANTQPEPQAPASVGIPPAGAAPTPSAPNPNTPPQAPVAPSTYPYYMPPVQGMPGPGFRPPAEPPKEDLTVYRHDGFFARVSLGLGPGRVALEPTLVADPTLLAEAKTGANWKLATHLQLLLGGTPTPGFVVGSGLMRWNFHRKKAGNDVTLLVLPLFVNYYLDPEGSWFLEGFIGIGSASLPDGNVAKGRSEAGGLALGGGGGWEAWVGEQGSLGLSLRVAYANAARDTATERYSIGLFLPTLSGQFTFH